MITGPFHTAFDVQRYLADAHSDCYIAKGKVCKCVFAKLTNGVKGNIYLALSPNWTGVVVLTPALLVYPVESSVSDFSVVWFWLEVLLTDVRTENNVNVHFSFCNFYYNVL